MLSMRITSLRCRRHHQRPSPSFPQHPTLPHPPHPNLQGDLPPHPLQPLRHRLESNAHRRGSLRPRPPRNVQPNQRTRRPKTHTQKASLPRRLPTRNGGPPENTEMGRTPSHLRPPRALRRGGILLPHTGSGRGRGDVRSPRESRRVFRGGRGEARARGGLGAGFPARDRRRAQRRQAGESHVEHGQSRGWIDTARGLRVRRGGGGG
mmetsp:Transcript_2263/g.4183  ORF Transcript_2263/g.4183 Transcript_2263/m.4183 type:complete len:207 (-) Transcript_2263:494-1114(-)